MSTILDALKKVEQERAPALDTDQQRQLDAIQPSTRNNRFRFGRRMINCAVLGMVLCLLAGAALFWHFSAPETSMPQKIDSPQGRGAPAEKQASIPSDNNRGKKSVSLETTLSRAPEVAGKQQRRESLPWSTTTESVPAGRQPLRSEEPDQNRTSSNNEPSSQAAFSAKPSPTPSTSVPVRNPAVPQLPSLQNAPRLDQPLQPALTGRSSSSPSYGVLDRLTDGSLKVQAIAWSPIADERMAVINSKIVREGNSVDDYNIVTISPNEVVVRKGGQMWRAEFGRP